MKPFQPQADEASSLLCRMPGCRSVWTVDILHGRVCSRHDEVLARGGATRPVDNPTRHQAPIPLRDAVRPFAEPAEHDDEEYVHDDTVQG